MRRKLKILRWMAAALVLLAGLVTAFAAEVPEGAGVIAGDKMGDDAFAAGRQLQPPHEKAAIIRLNAEVDDMMLRSIRRRVDVARKEGCTLIVFEVDTFGGQITSAIEITKLIKEIPDQDHMQTVAWIHDKAYSAGSLISAACQQIVMAKQGSIGDCLPIMVDTFGNFVTMSDVERGKITNPLLQEFANSAKVNGYPELVLDAMVVPQVVIEEMHNLSTGETRYVDPEEKAKLLAITVDAPGGVKEKPWHYVQTVNDDKSLLTLNAEDAVKMRLSSATIDTETQLKAAMNVNSPFVVLEFNWAEVATVFLTQWWVRGFLFAGMLVFAWIEVSHPGLSVAGIAALLCLILLVGAPFLTGLAQVWEIALIVLGLAIIIGDVVAFGGVSMLAIPGFILMAIGLVASFVPAEPGGGWIPTMASTWSALERGLAVVVGGCFAAIVAFYLLAKYLYLTPGFNRLQLAPTTGIKSSGTSITAAADLRDALDRPIQDAVFVGAIGMASTDLRPIGKARFGPHLVGVQSDGSFIGANQEVVVSEISGARIIVKRHVSQMQSRDQSGGESPSAGETPAGGATA